MSSVLVNVTTLAEWTGQQQPLVILDARARLGDASAGRQLWQQGHLPGAIHADMDKDLAAAPSDHGGRHPLPGKADFTASLQAWGITPQHRVVVYDDTGGQITAARAWWMLRWAGHPAAHVLDGGWQAWQRAGQPTTTAASPVTPSDWQPDYDDSLIASVDEVASGAAVLLDARAAERYRGDVEPIDPVAGHIPGARNVPGGSLLADDKTFLSAADLQQRLPDGDHTIAYCGSGVSACQLILAYASVDKPLPRLYPGSWSAWCRDPERPIATGNA